MWREHAPYQGTIDVTASDNKIYAATEYNLFSIDRRTKEIQRISKISGLTETGIAAINFNELTKQLLVAYTNSNIDLIDEHGVHNMPGLKRENISGDKNVYDVYADGPLFYLSTGIGIVVVDAAKFEISDAWLIGNNGGYVKTNAFARTDDFFFAATEEGLKQVPVNAAPSNFMNWTNRSGTNGLSVAACKGVVPWLQSVVALQNDSLFILKNDQWKFFFANGLPISSMNVAENKLLLCQRVANGSSQVAILNDSGSVVTTLAKENIISFPEQAASVGNEYWVADLFGGLSHWQGSTVETYKLNSPDNIALGQLTVKDNVLYAAAGAVNGSWNYQYNPNGLFQLKEGVWTSFNTYHYPQLNAVLDIISITIDARDGSLWAGSFGSGLVHITQAGNIDVLKENTPLETTIGDPGSYRVAGLAFDAAHNLWISNFGAPQPLKVLKADGSWQSFQVPFSLNSNAVAQILVDASGKKWIVSPLGNGLLVLDDGGTIDNKFDDRWKLFKAGQRSGNLPSNEVRSIAEDKDGFLWVGTDNGVAIIECSVNAFEANCNAVLPVIKQGNFANYLLKGEAVTAIAVDGANRKWMATNNGVWLVSKNGDELLHHFTAENSPLLSNDVRSIAINGLTGEVFFSTAMGICSFRGTATTAEDNTSGVLVFPNPVPPDYNGTIGIRGLPENSVIKITELNGRLVFQAKALGGQAVWNGKDYKGRRAATGVYLVLAVDENKTEKAVARIVFIGK
jgi:ligand-binding sensor domain-containing protein